MVTEPTASAAHPFRPTVSLGNLEPAIALGPLDGRYRGAIEGLVDYLSEPALNRMSESIGRFSVRCSAPRLSCEIAMTGT